MAFEFINTEIKGVVLIKPRIFEDPRGFFMETYKKSEFLSAGITEEFIQDNHSKSVKGVLRGIHFQKEPYGQGKLVRCVSGKIFDVAVDLRINSETYGKWVGFELSDENKYMLFIPKGLGHGFLTLSDEAEIFYKVANSEYTPSHDSGVIWNDSEIGIKWPLKEYEISAPILSEKDSKLQKFCEVNR